MAKTRADLSTRVLKELRILGEGESATGEQAQDVQEVYTSVLKELREYGRAHWDENAIPENVFLPLVKVVASESAAMFGVPYDAGDAARRLNALADKEISGEPVPADYF